METYDIRFPQEIFYKCISCGECCKRDWQICVEEEKKKSLEDFASKCSIQKPIILHPISKSLVIRIRKKDGCVFLKPDNFCMVHEQLGMKAKPMVCQTAPLLPIKMPRGYFIKISFACRSVIKNTGIAINSYSQSIKEFIDKGFVLEGIKYPVFLHYKSARRNSSPCGITIDEQNHSYLVKNFVLKELKSTTFNNDYFFKIWDILWKIFYRATDEKKEDISIDIINECIAKGESQLKTGMRTNNVVKKNLIYAIFLSYELVRREDKNPIIKYTNMLNLIRNRGVVNSKYGKLKLEDIEKIKFDIENPQVQELLKRYFGHIIESNWLLITPKQIKIWTSSVINTWGLLSLFYGLVIWYSKMFAYTRKSANVEMEDVENAVMMMETRYVSHIEREWWFINMPLFAKIFEQLANMPSFVPNILSKIR